MKPCPDVMSADDVDALIRAGEAIQTPKERGGGEGSRGAWDEYWNHAIRLPQLSKFFSRWCPPTLRRSAYADLSLYHYMRNAVPIVRFKPSSLGAQVKIDLEEVHVDYTRSKPRFLHERRQSGTLLCLLPPEGSETP